MSRSNRFFILALFAALLATSAHAAGPSLEHPHWSLEIKGGRHYPALDDWSTYYGKKYMNEYSGTIAYKLRRQLEVGIGAGSAKARGQAFAPLHNIASGDVTFELFPVHLFVLARGVLDETQWLAPYAGGGLTRMYYREKTEGQDMVRGSADGYHARAGVQLCLDGVDPGGANSMYLDYGVYHTYLFIEAEYTKARVKSTSVDLGGIAYLTGFLFEF